MARLVHLANFYGPRSGGLRTTVRALAAGYLAAGHEAHIVVPGERSECRQEDGVWVHHLESTRVPGSGGYRVILGRRRVLDLLERVDPDRIELSDRTTLLHVADWARERGVPTVMFAHERVDGVISAFAPALPAVRIADRMNSRATLRVDTIVCTTAFAAAEFQRVGVPTHRVALGVDLDLFAPRRRCTRWRARMQAPFLALLCSRLSKEKRPDFALDVAEELRRRRSPIRVAVAGDGPAADDLRRRAIDLRVPMLGFVEGRSRVATMLASVDAVLAPGPIETFGLAALEALASGTPVLSHQDSAVPEIVGPLAGHALPLEAATWADALELMASQSRSIWSRRARSRAEEFDWATTVETMLDLHRLPTAASRRASVMRSAA